MNRFLHFIIFCFLITVALNAQTKISTQQSKNGIEVTQKSKDGFFVKNSISHFNVQLEKTRSNGDYVELILEGYGNSYNIGNPDLPALNRLIEVPLEAQVEVIVTNYHEIIYKLSDYNINKPIIPSQESASKDEDISMLELVKNDTRYATNDWFANPVALYHEEGLMRGVRIGRLEINPFAYNPMSGELKVIDNLEVEVRFLQSNHAKTDQLKKLYNSPAFNGLFVGLLNYSAPTREDVTVNSVPMRFEIISQRMFESALEPFVTWKRKQGFVVNVRFTDEQEIGGTNASIKNYLQGIYLNATETNPAPAYIALIGDVEQIPTFKGGHPSDLPYTTYDGAGDFLPDVHIGRISAQNVAQLTAILNKTLIHEKFEMPDPSYLARTLTVAGFDEGASPTFCNGALNYIAHYFNAAHGISPTAMYHPCTGQTAQVVNKLSEGVGVAYYTAHCDPTGWSDPEIKAANIYSLNNTGKYGLYIANCCLSGKFDVGECIGETVIRAPNKGGAAYIGASNLSYWDEDYHWAVGYGAVVVNPQIADNGVGFFDSWFQENNEPEGLRAMTGSQMKMAGNLAVTQSNSTRIQYYWEIYHFLGDPTFMPYVGQMPAMHPNYDKALHLGVNSMTITNLAPHCYVALTENGNLKAAGFADHNGAITLEFEPFTMPCKADLVATTTFSRPFIETIDVISPNEPFITLQSYSLTQNAAFGETVGINLKLKNEATGACTASNVKLKVTSESPYISFPQSLIELDNIAAGATYNSENELWVTIAENVPNKETIVLNLLITCEYGGAVYEFERAVNFQTYAPILNIQKIYVENMNGTPIERFNPNTDHNLVVVFNNSGSMDLNNVNVAVSVTSEYLNVENNATAIATIGKGNTASAKFLMHAGNAPAGALASMVVRASSGAYTEEMSYTNSIGNASVFYMSNETLSAEYANFYDSGGPNNAYSPNENYKFTFLPVHADKKLKISFSAFNVEENSDNLYIYDGVSVTGSSLAATLTGATLPQDFTATNDAGALTFVFKSNANTQPAGWAAIICEAENYHNISFIITDENNQPVTDAKITFDGYILAKNQFEVTLVAAGKYSYTINKEGYETVSGKITVENGDEEVSVKLVKLSVANHSLESICIYPNPTSGTLHVTSDALHVTNGTPSVVEVEVYDILGRKQKAESRKGEMEKGEVVMDVSHLPAGVYFVKIRTGAGEVVKKVVKQ